MYSTQLEENFRTDLNVPSAYQSFESAKNCNASCDTKIKILSSSPTLLSYTKKGSPFVVVRYACGRSGMSSSWIGVGGMFLTWREWRTFLLSVSSDGRFAATPSEIFRSSVPSICRVVSSVSSARPLTPALTLVTWHSVYDGAWVCSCINLKIRLTVRWELDFSVTGIPYSPINTLPHTESSWQVSSVDIHISIS